MALRNVYMTPRRCSLAVTTVRVARCEARLEGIGNEMF